jgi:hypothetical protein
MRKLPRKADRIVFWIRTVCFKELAGVNMDPVLLYLSLAYVYLQLTHALPELNLRVLCPRLLSSFTS